MNRSSTQLVTAYDTQTPADT